MYIYTHRYTHTDTHTQTQTLHICTASLQIFINPLPEQPYSAEPSAALKHSIMGRGGRVGYDEDDENVVPGAGLRIPNIKTARLYLSQETPEFKWPLASGRLANYPLLLGEDTLPWPT